MDAGVAGAEGKRASGSTPVILPGAQLH